MCAVKYINREYEPSLKLQNLWVSYGYFISASNFCPDCKRGFLLQRHPKTYQVQLGCVQIRLHTDKAWLACRSNMTIVAKLGDYLTMGVRSS
jgi:hypothetical protein